MDITFRLRSEVEIRKLVMCGNSTTAPENSENLHKLSNGVLWKCLQELIENQLGLSRPCAASHGYRDFVMGTRNNTLLKDDDVVQWGDFIVVYRLPAQIDRKHYGTLCELQSYEKAVEEHVRQRRGDTPAHAWIRVLFERVVNHEYAVRSNVNSFAKRRRVPILLEKFFKVYDLLIK